MRYCSPFTEHDRPRTIPAADQRASGFFQNNYPSISLSMNFAHKYVFFIKGDSLDEITEEALHFVYVFLMRTLQEHRRQGRNGAYEDFAVEVLALLQKYRYVYTTPADAPEPDRWV